MTQARTYTAPHPVYICGVLHPPGEPFTTSAPRGAAWRSFGAAEKAAAKATDPRTFDDATLETLSVTELKRHAAAIGIDAAMVKDKALLVATIRAARAPTD